MSILGKLVAIIFTIALAAILIASIVDAELRWSGIVFVAAVCIIWRQTRE